MKKAALFSGVVMVFVISTFSFAALWLRTPALWVINLPESAWLFLVDKLGATCCEKSADIEFAVAVVFGFVATCVLSLVLYGIYRWLERGNVP